MTPKTYFLKACPICNQEAHHAPDCRLIATARSYYEDKEMATVVPDDAQIEDVGDGCYRVEASVFVHACDMEDEEPEEE